MFKLFFKKKTFFRPKKIELDHEYKEHQRRKIEYTCTKPYTGIKSYGMSIIANNSNIARAGDSSDVHQWELVSM